MVGSRGALSCSFTTLLLWAKRGVVSFPPTSPLFAYNHGHGRPMPGATLRFTPASQKSPPFSLFFRISGANFQWNNAFNTFKNQTGILLL